MTNLEFSFVFGLMFGIKEFEIGYRAFKYQELMNALTFNQQSHEIDSWITELIQNSQDQKAKNIGLKLTKDNDEQVMVTFTHDGTQFKPLELMVHMKMYSSTKTVDLSTVGRFGIGFKYWMLFFNQLEVKSTDTSREYKLLDIPSDSSFNPKLKVVNKDCEEKSTTFKFSV